MAFNAPACHRCGEFGHFTIDCTSEKAQKEDDAIAALQPKKYGATNVSYPATTKTNSTNVPYLVIKVVKEDQPLAPEQVARLVSFWMAVHPAKPQPLPEDANPDEE